MKQPRLFFFCFAHDRPTGGNKQIYKHVDILNRNGFEAYVFHPRADFRLTWFANETRVLDQDTVRRLHDPATDILVLPEDLGLQALNFPGTKVILNQNLYYGFAVFGQQAQPVYPYLDPSVVAVLTKSEHNSEHLSFAFPNLKIFRLYNGVSSERFRYCPLAGKKKQITCVVKATQELYALYHMLEARASQGLNRLADFRWVFLEGKTEAEVADILHDSLILVFLSILEGTPLAPIEAFLSGCLVTAFRAGPLSEALPAEATFPPNDILAVARRIEAIAETFPERIAEWEPAAEAGRRAAQSFTMRRQEESTVEAWTAILESVAKERSR